jgi:hypothetical protein
MFVTSSSSFFAWHAQRPIALWIHSLSSTEAQQECRQAEGLLFLMWKFSGAAFSSQIVSNLYFAAHVTFYFYYFLYVAVWKTHYRMILFNFVCGNSSIWRKKFLRHPKPSQPWWGQSLDPAAWLLHRANILAVTSLGWVGQRERCQKFLVKDVSRWRKIN